MAADPVAKALEDLNRTLKEILSALNKQNMQLKTFNHNYLEVNKKPDDVVLPPFDKEEPVVVPPKDETLDAKRVYGWSMAASVQREGGLKVGDQKVEKDNSHWFWTGEIWERVELPSGKT